MDIHMSKHFKLNEFGCKCCGIYIVNYHLHAILELVRLKFNAPVMITSGTRCKTHNKAVGGMENSKHLTGEAADIVVKGVHPQLVYNYLDSIFKYTLGIGNYDTFTHIDTREEHSRW